MIVVIPAGRLLGIACSFRRIAAGIDVASSGSDDLYSTNLSFAGGLSQRQGPDVPLLRPHVPDSNLLLTQFLHKLQKPQVQKPGDLEWAGITGPIAHQEQSSVELVATNSLFSLYDIIIGTLRCRRAFVGQH
ncbi:hypothetical protein JX265_010056 [Neoarthrinium moseri]|uniref:Uncharacterized protein n=1 Tax=Neoarthrinium moseri TaxID=1658444 RepID=A0A9P9WF41_9PEZI|nr:hypothetical protein JX265_010056 [Neoarthrinium moseri]